MSDDVHRLLELVQRELGADDARLELGGREPESDVLWSPLPDQEHRIVVIYDEAPDAPLDALRSRLELLLRGFSFTIERPSTPPRPSHEPRRALDDALDVLATQTGAVAALVIDESSPMIWGHSLRGPENVDDAMRAAEALALADAAGVDLAAELCGEPSELPEDLARALLDVREAATGRERDEREWRDALRCFASLGAVRALIDNDQGEPTRFAIHDPDLGVLTRNFASIYWLMLVFDDGQFSELHVEAAMIHASGWIERLVERLPPVDPGGKGGRVVSLRRLRPV